MTPIQYNQLLSFIWNIASDVLVNAFEKGEYKKVIMPFLVLRRIDVLLEPTKKDVLEKKKWIDENNLSASQDQLLFKVTGYPFYNISNFTLHILKSDNDPKQLHKHFIEYLDGFSSDVIDIIDKFKLKQIVDNLTDSERLGSVIEKFTDERYNLSNKPILDDDGTVALPALDNHTMGTIFEELLRRFNEENNVTEAGEHFTPRDYVKLMADLALIPVADKITDNTYHVYDAACGTGGILTIAQERIEEIAKEHGKQVNVKIFGQEQQPDTYATCKAELMISGHINSFHYQLESEQKDYIAYDSTLSRDGHKNETFDFCISNPPFGIPWKEDLKKWGIEEKKKKDISDPRFVITDENGEEISFIPNIDDSQMLFLANNISRMRDDTPLGTRIVEVHDGSSLFTGDAGSGPSNLRQYIIEHDLLEAIIAMPENDFYNAGIGTYIWVLTNKKEPRRQGYVQLIDATDIKTPLRKNLGKKNCETTKKDRDQIMKLIMDFKDTARSKIFPNDEFGYWNVKIYQPQRDEFGNIVYDEKGKVVINKKSKESENIPLRYKGGIDGFLKKEILPYTPDAWIDPKSIEKGYEIIFSKYFFKPQELKSLNSIKFDLYEIEERINGLMKDILKIKNDNNKEIIKGLSYNGKMKDSGISWIGMIPAHWQIKQLRCYLKLVSEKGHPEAQLLSVVREKGVIIRNVDSKEENHNFIPDDLSGYKYVTAGQFVINKMKSWQGSYAVSKYTGIVSPAYYVCDLNFPNIDFFNIAIRSKYYIPFFKQYSKGIRVGQWDLSPLGLKNIPFFEPPKEEQQAIVNYIEEKQKKVDNLIAELKAEIDLLMEYKPRLIADCVTGQMNISSLK